MCVFLASASAADPCRLRPAGVTLQQGDATAAFLVRAGAGTCKRFVPWRQHTRLTNTRRVRALRRAIANAQSDTPPSDPPATITSAGSGSRSFPVRPLAVAGAGPVLMSTTTKTPISHINNSSRSTSDPKPSYLPPWRKGAAERQQQTWDQNLEPDEHAAQPALDARQVQQRGLIAHKGPEKTTQQVKQAWEVSMTTTKLRGTSESTREEDEEKDKKEEMPLPATDAANRSRRAGNSRSATSTPSSTDAEMLSVADTPTARRSNSKRSTYTRFSTGTEGLPDHLENLVARGEWRRAVTEFEEARRTEFRLEASRRGEEGANRALLTCGSYNQALLAYATGRNGRAALDLLRDMRSARERGERRLAPTRGSYNACLKACRDGNERSKVLGVLEMMVEDGITPSGRSYSFALQACAKDGNVADARKMLNDMWTSPDLEGGVPGLRPTTWGFNCAMEACLDHDAFTYGAALEACGRVGNWGQAEIVVGQMAEAYAESVARGGAGKSPLTPSAVHCNALLNAYCRGGR
eukprot:jgi/Undpi1/3359/HiC_scaffold_15.g06732.m1